MVLCSVVLTGLAGGLGGFDWFDGSQHLGGEWG